jgi:hypothetical protein
LKSKLFRKETVKDMKNLVERISNIDPNLKRKKSIIVKYGVCGIFYKYCCFCFSKNKDKHKLYEKGFEKVSYNLNVLTYIRKMHEIDLMKHLLFDEDQINLINFLSKPSVSLANKMDIYEDISKKRNTSMRKDEIDKIYSSYSKEILKTKYKDVDLKLINLFKNEMEHLVHES